MAVQIFANNAFSLLQATIAPGDTSIAVSPADAALYPSPSAGDWFIVTVEDNTKLEIMKCTGRAAEVLTVVRAQEGTIASAFTAGSRVDMRLTAGAIGNFVQPSTLTAYVLGPLTATDNALVRFDGTTGKIVQNSNAIVDDGGNMALAGGILVGGGAAVIGALSAASAAFGGTLSAAGTTLGATTVTTFSTSATVTMSPANANVTLSPTGSGTVTINPAVAGAINRMNIGAATPGTGNFTALTIAAVAVPTVAQVVRVDVVQGLAAAPRAIARANSGLVIPPACRLSLTAATPITVSDVIGATTVRLIPFQGELLPVWSVTDTEFKVPVLAELNYALDSNAAHTNYQQADRNFDVFAFLNTGVLTFGNGPSWNAGAVAGSDVARGTGAGSTELELWHGLLVNKNAIALRVDTTAGTVAVAAREATYIATMRATANGVVEDSAAKRFISNGYLVNRVRRDMRVLEATNSWTYTVATIRQANAAATNQLDYVRGIDGDSVEASIMASSQNSTASVIAAVFIGLDSTTAAAAGATNNVAYGPAGFPHHARADYRGNPGLGRHTLVWLEYSVATGVTTWYGDNNTPLVLQSGIAGSVMG